MIDVNKVYKFTIETTLGTMTGELHAMDAPVTVNSFVFLAREGYFDGVIVHRVLKGFVLQTGDPTGTGSGGPGYRFHDEEVVGEYLKGTLAMANSGPNTNGSQFFVVLDDLRGRLPKDYTIFGQVDDTGFGVIDAIAEVEVMVPAGGSEKSRPVEEIIVQKVTIEEQ
ncbi:MAG: peptidylprolyl isomerase [Chloroflexi bacterium]|nr:peptidylprolyl isomerase [Chloroflexota bacterium]MCY3938902.1 peptidylprolyl isomerase [Chloroflexota bacterium]